jgi:uncharacterized protein (TIGR03435 family)
MYPITYALLLVSMLFAQPQAGPRLSFEVASIKTSTSNGPIMIGPQPGGRFVATSVPTRTLIRLAYRVEDFQIDGGPGWMNSDRYQVEARANGTIPFGELHRYLESLLEERFKLRVRREFRDRPVYALLVAKDGPKIEPLKDKNGVPLREIAIDFNMPPPPPPPPPGAGAPRRIPDPATLPLGVSSVGGQGSFVGSAQKIESLVRVLSMASGRPVVDKTGLTGFFHIKLLWAPEGLQAIEPADPSGPSLFTAVQEQLGLRLESQTAPIEFIVIESLERPTEN